MLRTQVWLNLRLLISGGLTRSSQSQCVEREGHCFVTSEYISGKHVLGVVAILAFLCCLLCTEQPIPL